MRDRFLVGRTAQRLIARPSPPFNRKFIEPSFGEMPRENFGRRARVFLLMQEDFAGAAVERPAAALKQAVVGRILDQRVLEAIICVRAAALSGLSRRTWPARRWSACRRLLRRLS